MTKKSPKGSTNKSPPVQPGDRDARGPAPRKRKKAKSPRRQTQKVKDYDDETLCEDIASGTFTTRQIAERHKVSMGLVRKIARGDIRPELKERIDELHDDYRAETERLFRAQVRHTGTLLLKQREKDGMAGVKATIESLRLGGLGTGITGAEDTVILIPFKPPPDKPPANGKETK